AFRTCSLRLEAQDGALSRPKQGFESPRERHFAVWKLLRSAVCVRTVLGLLMYVWVHSASCAPCARKPPSLVTLPIPQSRRPISKEQPCRSSLPKTASSAN